MKKSWMLCALLASAGCFEHEDAPEDAADLVADAPTDVAPDTCPATQPPDLSACSVEGQDCSWGPEACQCGTCHPAFGCSCLEGTWRCWHTDPIPESWCAPDVPEPTQDVPGSDEDVVGDVAPACPAEAPVGVPGTCPAGLVCSYGQECCCGQCHPSTVCQCSGEGWGCYATDACLIPGCPDVPPAQDALPVR